MRSPSDLPIIGKHRCSRTWVNKTEGPKTVSTQHSKGFRELSTKLIEKKRVALIMLIIALQFDVSTSKKKKEVALIMLIIALMN